MSFDATELARAFEAEMLEKERSAPVRPVGTRSAELDLLKGAGPAVLAKNPLLLVRARASAVEVVVMPAGISGDVTSYAVRSDMIGGWPRGGLFSLRKIMESQS